MYHILPLIMDIFDDLCTKVTVSCNEHRAVTAAAILCRVPGRHSGGEM